MNTAPNEQRPILSICIPTYNRDVWLDASLSIISEEIKDLGNDIEVVVSNNASTDHTEAVVKKHKSTWAFAYSCNSENCGAMRNMAKCIGMASGKYVWILGDDDFLIAGFLKKLLKLIRGNPDTPFFFVDMVIWHPKKEYKYGDSINCIENVDANYLAINSLEFKKYDKLKEIATYERGYFNAISNFILLKEDYSRAFQIGVNAGEEFTSVESTFPHSYYMARFLLKKPCIDVITKGLICSGTVGWKKYYEITWLKWFPELIILMAKNGAAKRNALNGRKNIIKSKYYVMLPKALRGEISNYEYFSWCKFIKDNFYIKDFWIVIYHILRGHRKTLLQFVWNRVKSIRTPNKTTLF